MRKSSESPQTLIYFEEIAKQLARGLEPEAVARESNLDLTFVNKCITSDGFDEVFSAIDPDSFKAWKEAQNASISQRRVKTMAKEDSVENYEGLMKLVRESSTLTDKERGELLLKLLAMSGMVDKEFEVKQIVLAPNQMETIQQTFKETQ